MVPQGFMIQHESESTVIRKNMIVKETHSSAGMKCSYCNMSQRQALPNPMGSPAARALVN